MKIYSTVKEEVEIKTLHVQAGVRYWEDATINGVEDETGHLTPFRKGDCWCPVIEIDTGKVMGWPKGYVADIHFKVCDDGSYYIKDAEGNTVLSIEDDYVPKIMCPGGEGYGDYIIMKINGDGFIENWKPKVNDFQDAQ